MKLYLLCFFSFLLFFFNSIFPQNLNEKDFREIVPGKNYAASGFQTFLLGNDWRKLWTTPVKIKELDLNKFDGGMLPVKKVTGTGSNYLLFKSKNGNYWKFSLLNIEPEKIFPKEILENAAGKILNDQICIVNPFAPLITNNIINGIDSSDFKSILIYLPDNGTLGKFQNEFGGSPGILRNKNKCLDTSVVINTQNLLKKIEDGSNEIIDSKSYLKERLIDIFLGEWSRGEDKWCWEENEKNGIKIWSPIAKERVLAFSKINGIVGKSASEIVPQLCSFDKDYPDIEKITWSGRFLDRRILTGIDKYTWDSVTNHLYSKLTDSLIINSVNKLPPEDIKIAGQELKEFIISRRNKLPQISSDYYTLINKVADIYSAAINDSAEVKRLNDNFTKVSLFRINSANPEKIPERYFKKIFNNNITDEIRIHLGKGDDKAIVKGKVDSGPLVRIIGGSGKDVLEDSSIVKGHFLSFIPIPSAEVKTEFYDTNDDTKFITGSSTTISSIEERDNESGSDKNQKVRDRGHEWLFLPEFSYDENNGFVFGGGPLLYKYDFGYSPYKYRMSLTASYSTRSQTINIFYDGNFYSWINKSKVHINFKKSELELIKFFGYGNETAFNSGLDSKDYYRMVQKLVGFYPDISFGLSGNYSYSLGFSLENSNVSLNNSDTLLHNFPYGRYGIGRFNIAGVNLSLEYNTGDEIYNSYKGYHIHFKQEYYPKLLDNRSSFTKTDLDLRYFFTWHFLSETTLALRGGGEKIWGKFPLFKSVFLGGDKNLLGFSRERFAGNADLYGQLELRFLIKELEVLLKEKLGMSLFTETGRVFSNSGNSKKWHPSYGFGFWSSIIQRKINFSLIFAFSSEKTSIYADTKFMF